MKDWQKISKVEQDKISLFLVITIAEAVYVYYCKS